MEPLRAVVGVAGRIGSGKTTLSEVLSTELEWPYVSFGTYLRGILAREGDRHPSREALQNAAVPEMRDWRAFCDRVLRDSGWTSGRPAVVDGVRHIKACEALSVLASPVPFELIYIEVPEDVLLSRLTSKGIRTGEDLRRFESHDAEGDAPEVMRNSANLPLDGRLPPSILRTRVISWLERLEATRVEQPGFRP